MRIIPPRRRIKVYLYALLLVFIIKVPWIYLVYDRGEVILSGGAKKDLLSRRAYLIRKTRSINDITGLMPSMLSSQFQGEWGLVTYSMLSAALVNLSYLYPETREESKSVVGTLIERSLSSEIKSFDQTRWGGEDPMESLSGENGHVGYLGHLNWMLSAYKFLDGDSRFDEAFHLVSTALSKRFLKSTGFCLETYPDETYLPDNVVAVASIANYSALNGGVFGETVRKWVSHAKSNWGSTPSGILPFHLDKECRPLNQVKGSGAGWNSFYLPFIDKDLAEHQYKRIKDRFLQRRLITGLREYPKGVFGLGDVDSGPVLLGFSPSGTGFLIGGASHAKDAELLGELLFTAELVGSTVSWNGERYYLLSPLIGDAIILAMKTATTWKVPGEH